MFDLQYGEPIRTSAPTPAARDPGRLRIKSGMQDDSAGVLDINIPYRPCTCQRWIM